MVKVASQTQKENNSEKFASINPDNTTRQRADWFVVGENQPVMERSDVNLLVRSDRKSQIYYANEWIVFVDGPQLPSRQWYHYGRSKRVSVVESSCGEDRGQPSPILMI